MSASSEATTVHSTALVASGGGSGVEDATTTTECTAVVTKVSLTETGHLVVGGRKLPKKRVADDEQSKVDYEQLYKYASHAVSQLQEQKRKMVKIMKICAPDTAHPSAVVSAPNAHESSADDNDDDDDDDNDSLMGGGVSITSLPENSVLLKTKVKFDSWAHKVTLESNPFEKRSAKNEKGASQHSFPHLKRLESDDQIGLWVETGRKITFTIKFDLHGSGADQITSSTILANANKHLAPGERHRHELVFSSYVVDGDVVDPKNARKQTRPTSIGDDATIENGCVYIDEADGARFTNLLVPFNRKNKKEVRKAKASGSSVTFDDFKFRHDALSGSIKNTSNGSVRLVFVPEHPVLRRIEAFYTVSDEFKLGARVRPIAKEKPKKERKSKAAASDSSEEAETTTP